MLLCAVELLDHLPFCVGEGCRVCVVASMSWLGEVVVLASEQACKSAIELTMMGETDVQRVSGRSERGKVSWVLL